MNLMVPTFMVKGMVCKSAEVNGKTIAAGTIVDMPYGHALVLKALGGISAIVSEEDQHVTAQEWLNTYGADCWFPNRQQTISRVADYLASIDKLPMSGQPN